MDNRRKAMYLGAHPLPAPNTFIGGVGATSITSRADYLAMTTVLVSNDIKNFQIDGNNNVSFYVGKNYNMEGASALYLDNNMTYFLDIDGHVLSGTSISVGIISGTAITHAYLPGFTGLGSRRLLFNCTSLKKATVLSSTVAYNTARTFSNADLLDKIVLNTITSFAQSNAAFYAFDGMANVKRVYMPLVTSMVNLVEDASKDPASITMFNGIGGNPKIYYNSALGSQARYAFMAVNSGAGWIAGETFVFNGLTYTAVIGAPATDGEFQIDVINNGIRTANVANAIQNDTRTGTISPKPVTVYRTNFMLFECVSTGQAFADSITFDFVTGNAGRLVISNMGSDDTGFVGGDDVHPLLFYLREQAGCTLVELSAPIAVNAPTSLSASNQTATSVDLNFTLPTANANGTDVYEVWVDDGTLYRKLFDYAEITTTGDTLDLTEVFDDVGSISGTKIKIRTMDNHFNFSAFSNEITLP